MLYVYSIVLICDLLPAYVGRPILFVSVAHFNGLPIAAFSHGSVLCDPPQSPGGWR